MSQMTAQYLCIDLVTLIKREASYIITDDVATVVIMILAWI